mmetsp:Transcript_18780/g.49889  ORF Transcript_18780/g.49889 Transcript_18780/m.49889 type:complete len:91 (-) Transcript_18780:21-293(-)
MPRDATHAFGAHAQGEERGRKLDTCRYLSLNVHLLCQALRSVTCSANQIVNDSTHGMLAWPASIAPPLGACRRGGSWKTSGHSLAGTLQC